LYAKASIAIRQLAILGESFFVEANYEKHLAQDSGYP
jgi:hypothetical protein